MTAHKHFGLALLAASSPLALASSAFAQTPAPAPAPSAQPPAPASAQEDPFTDEPAIVVTGQRERGAVMGDVKPLQQFDAGDIRALGVSNINELLTELGPQVQSASGRPPVMLLEGQRMSSPREIASLPSEAIQRVDILPEEVGLRYGYGADQRVVNIVLRERFRATNVELEARVPTAGGTYVPQGEVGFLSIRNGRRFNLGAELRTQDSLYETERGLTGPDSAFRTLLPSERQLTINTTYKMPLAERLFASLNGQVVSNQQEASIGYNGATGALERVTNRLTAHSGFTLTRDRAKGQLSLTGNFDHGFTRTISDRQLSLPADVSRSYTDTAELDLLYSTPLARLPSGDLSFTAHLTGSTQSFKSSRVRDLITTGTRLTRSSGGGSVNLNIPIAGMGTPLSETIGNLSANADASLSELSDAGTIHSYSGGFNWQPAKILSFTGNYTVRKTAPTAQQLGDAQTITTNVPIFDYVRGETTNVTTISGGNPNLAKAENRSFRIGMSLSPLKDPQLNFQVDFSKNRTTGGIASLPGVTATTMAAFPGRFTRLPLDPDDPADDDQQFGRLSQVDLRAINIGEQKSSQLRWGFNLNIQLKTPQSQIRAFQEVARKRIEERIASGQIPAEVAARLRQALDSGQLPGQGGQQGQRGPQGQTGAQQAQGAAPQGTPAQGQTPQQAAAGQQGAAGQQAQGEGGAAIVVTAPSGTAPAGGNFVFQGPGGPGGPGGGPPGGFRGPGGGFGGGGFGGGGFGGFGGGGGGGGQGGAPRGGRLNFSVYHTWLLDSTTQLAPGLPIIDQLNGGTLGGGASPARHQLQVQAGYTQGGLGFRSFINWNAATRSIGSSGQQGADLRFGALTTVNFRVFMNFQQMPKLVDSVPFLRGSRLTFGANNLFDARQKVTDGTGVTPYAYQGAFLDRFGRSVTVEFRKLIF